jgi:hypothetical protein
MDESTRPEGIEHRHIHDARGSLFARWPFSLVCLGALLAVALAGGFGADARLTGTGNDVALTLDGPIRIRNGNFYDTVLTVETGRDIRDLVVLVDQDVWYEVTVNTVLPEPSEYGFRDGFFELRFGRLSAGDSLVLKISAQINSGRNPSTNAGQIALADGDVVLATIDYALEVLP